MSLASVSLLCEMPEVLERVECAQLSGECAASVQNPPAELCQTIPILSFCPRLISACAQTPLWKG